jgi:hypothetical protein
MDAGADDYLIKPSAHVSSWLGWGRTLAMAGMRQEAGRRSARVKQITED